MASKTKKAKAADVDAAKLTADQQAQTITQPNEQQEKAAQCELELVRLFLVHGKQEIARRRLQNILAQFHQTQAATEAEQILQAL